LIALRGGILPENRENYEFSEGESSPENFKFSKEE
jgi:hypothetical protein